ncbi:hypothetical protein QCN14_14100, partial [Enterobacter roggenkampii]|uniref:hypothetical protein n=1 Tax=Enterobacter roggenkampii TaxID=1812935 RepID=UPI002FD84DE3
KRAYCLKTQPATGETYPKSDLFNKAVIRARTVEYSLIHLIGICASQTRKVAQEYNHERTHSP